MQITPAGPADWPRIWPIFAAVVEDGETYAYPWPLSPSDAQAIWLEPPPGHAVVAVDGDEVLGTAKMGPNRPGRGAHVATASSSSPDVTPSSTSSTNRGHAASVSFSDGAAANASS